MPPKAIPDRWTSYKACGKVIEGTRFICFKVPLKRSVQSNNREIEKIWDIPTVLADIPKLGAVIDLTNTARYYNPVDFLKANVLHKKILMPGRIVPPESSVKEFMLAVDEFLAKDSESLIGVHCTHGLNRTGYMVCRYMRDKLGIPAQATITKFEAARGYKMERDIYINDILGTKNQTNDVGKETEVIPVSNSRNDVTYRRTDVTYRSPLEEDIDTPVDNSRRFGNNRSNNDRFGYNRNNNSNRTDSSSGGLFSCYTNRYNNLSGNRSDRDRSDRVRSDSDRSDRNRSDRNRSDRDRSKRDRRSNGSPLSWRNRGESTGVSSQRSRTDDGSRNTRDDNSRRRT